MREQFKQKFPAAFNDRSKGPPPLPKFVLKGDVSGIQNFIFNIQSDVIPKILKTNYGERENLMSLLHYKRYWDNKKSKPSYGG